MSRRPFGSTNGTSGGGEVPSSNRDSQRPAWYRELCFVSLAMGASSLSPPGPFAVRNGADRCQSVFDPPVPGMTAAQAQAVCVAVASRKDVARHEADAVPERLVEKRAAVDWVRKLHPQDEP